MIVEANSQIQHGRLLRSGGNIATRIVLKTVYIATASSI